MSINANNEDRWIDGRKVWFTPSGAVAADAYDRTDVITDRTGYNADCSACWVGRPHTTRYHQAKLA